MKVYVLFAQRNERYPGEYALEALAVASECDYDDNPDYLNHELQKAKEGDEFAAVALVTLSVPEASVRKVLFPQSVPIQAEVQP